MNGTVLLTGATGFLGSHVLAELLASGDAAVLCLARAEDDAAAAERIVSTLRRFGLMRPGFAERIEGVAGDLAAPRLGLGRRFASLASRVDAICHDGAQVNHVLGYAQLKPVNVDGTQELIRVAESRGLPFTYISTLRLFDHRSTAAVIRENEPVDRRAVTANGYAHTKAVAERLVTVAAARGLPAAIHRPGLLCGDGDAGVPNVSDVVCRLMKGCVQAGIAPASALHVNLTSVAYAARGIVALARDPRTQTGCWHLVHDEPTRIDRLMQGLRDYGYPLEAQPYAAWVEAIRAACREGDNEIAPVLGHFTPDLPERSRDRVFSSAVTRRALAAHGIAHPEITDTFIASNIRGLVAFGFLDKPAADGRRAS